MTLSLNALTTLEAVLDELGLERDRGSQDDRLERYINAASDLFERACARKFHFVEDHQERVGVANSDRLVVYEHTPVASVSSISFEVDGNTSDSVDPSSYALENAQAGFIRRFGGVWGDTRMRGRGLSPEVGGPVRGMYVVTYSGGYVTPRTTSLTEGTSSGGVGLKVRDVLGFKAGDQIIIDRGTSVEETATIDQISVANKTLTVSSLLASTHSAGATVELVQNRTLPYDIEDAVIQYVAMRNAQRGADQSIKSLKLLDGSITYADVEGEKVPSSFAAAIDRYRRMFL